MDALDVPQGRFELARFPASRDTSLRAWDAADEYVLAHLAALPAASLDGRWLVVNDAFGALAVALASRTPQSWSDSCLAHAGARANLQHNGLSPDVVALVPSTEQPQGPIRAAVLKIPRALAMLEDQLHRLRPLLTDDAAVVGAGMTRDVHTSTIDLFQRLIGPTQTTLARRKARLILAQVDPARAVGPSPHPTTWQSDDGFTVVNHANVFSRERLDGGARLLLAHLPAWAAPTRVVDLGCGNGVVGTTAAVRNPSVTVTFVDESYMAVASAEATCAGALPGRDADFHVADVFDGLASDSADVVLCNPPFHAQRARGHEVARRMFQGARRVLRDGGELFVVGNRHLGYHLDLDRIFGRHEVVGSDPKFVVLRAQAGRR